LPAAVAALALVGALLAGAGSAAAQAEVGGILAALARESTRTRLINVDTARVLMTDLRQYGVDVRAFGDPDGQAYLSGHILWGVADDYQLELIGSFADTGTHTTAFTTLRYGGTNFEIRAKRGLLGRGDAMLSAIGGLEFPNTPSQDEPHLALHLPITIDGLGRTSGHIVPKFIFLNGNTVSSLGLGVQHILNERLELMAELTPTIGGANTRNARGGLSDDGVWGLGLRWTACDDTSGLWQIDVGITNGKGRTSSFGVAPGILDSTAFYAAATFTEW
jgi:hypothetical protein